MLANQGHVFIHKVFKELFCHSYQFLPCSNSLDLSSFPSALEAPGSCTLLCFRVMYSATLQ